jgi:hypothetical protein
MKPMAAAHMASWLLGSFSSKKDNMVVVNSGRWGRTSSARVHSMPKKLYVDRRAA